MAMLQQTVGLVARRQCHWLAATGCVGRLAGASVEVTVANEHTCAASCKVLSARPFSTIEAGVRG